MRTAGAGLPRLLIMEYSNTGNDWPFSSSISNEGIRSMQNLSACCLTSHSGSFSLDSNSMNTFVLSTSRGNLLYCAICCQSGVNSMCFEPDRFRFEGVDGALQ
uniref:Uncharacterized protein n=1 Tax=Cacopsylla melanoneura TaxID=428564 RepID=A0A8D8TM79_9HEMI